tara:strand:+ start:9118 stop:10098 length:981 start_codon:yes stop_codon:yes gene_type:complete
MIIETLYIEKRILDNKYTKKVIHLLKPKHIIYCQNFKEIFNLKKQNFRIQKYRPSMILAKKENNFLIKTPKDFNIGGKNNYYFSHMYNCIFDCKYCYLQGMFNSANYVLFVNYESFFLEIKRKLDEKPNEDIYFFSGYDCDSLALEKVTGFAGSFINFFRQFKRGFLELRTKSCQVDNFLEIIPTENIIFAWSLNPQSIITKFEDKTPALEKRLDSILKLQQRKWKIGLRFDPIILENNFEKIYNNFFEDIFKKLKIENIHSVTVGSLRLPDSYVRKFQKNSLNFNLIANTDGRKYFYNHELSDYAKEFCVKKISQYCDKNIIFTN